MKKENLLFLFVFAFGVLIQGQDTIIDVLNNTVSPCTLTYGEIINASTLQQLKDAINLANSVGGNRTILIADGIYEIASTSWYPYITGSNIVFRSSSGNRDAVILKGGGMHYSSGTENGFYIAGNNVVIADLTIKEVGNHGIAAHGDFIHIYNVKIQDTYEQMVKGTASGDGADNGTVKFCLLEYTAGIGPQYYIGGLDIHMGDDWVVSDNVFRHIKSPSGSVAQHAVHFWNNSSNNIVERNLIIDCDRGIGFGLGSSPNTGGIIRSNMIYNDGSGIFNDVGIALESSPYSMVYNNTVYIEYMNSIEYRFSSTINADIKNNLTNRPVTQRDGASATLSHNVTDAQPGWFVNLSEGNLSLNFPVPAVVDAGADLSAYVSDDIYKTQRPVGPAFDIGAHEYVPYEDFVELESFSAHGAGNTASISWTTAWETDVLGFWLYRLVGKKINPFISYVPVLLNSSIMPGQGTPYGGFTYSYTDYVKNGAKLFYILQIESNSGETLEYRTRLQW